MARGNSPAREARAARLTRAIRRIVLGVSLVVNFGARAQPPEPEGYRMDDYRAPTPDGVAGGIVLDTEAAHKLWTGGNAIWIDVLPASRRPPNLPPSALWMPLVRRDIPGSLWLPEIGRGALNPELEEYFRDHLDSATRGRRNAPVVFYCLTDCWMSWNAAKRAASWGYTQVYWYPAGTDGWEAARLPMENAEPVPGP
jgi:PQQ-dependent catabolism-associated CXXCW motif protein